MTVCKYLEVGKVLVKNKSGQDNKISFINILTSFVNKMKWAQYILPEQCIWCDATKPFQENEDKLELDYTLVKWINKKEKP